MNWSSRTGPFAEVTFGALETPFVFIIILFGAPKSFKIPPNAAPATKSDTATSPNAAPATKSGSPDSPTSPNIAPATKSHAGDVVMWFAEMWCDEM